MLSDRILVDIGDALTEADVQNSIAQCADDAGIPRCLDSADWLYYWGRLFGLVAQNMTLNAHMPPSWHDQYRRNMVRMWEAAAFERTPR